MIEIKSIRYSILEEISFSYSNVNRTLYFLHHNDGSIWISTLSNPFRNNVFPKLDKDDWNWILVPNKNAFTFVVYTRVETTIRSYPLKYVVKATLGEEKFFLSTPLKGFTKKLKDLIGRIK